MVVALTVSVPAVAQGKGKPRWVNQDEEKLNKKRYNETYEFKVFNTYDLDLGKLQRECFKPLYSYLAEQYGSDANKMSVDSLYLEADSVPTYCITLPTDTGERMIYAKRVDQYDVYEDYELNSYQFEYYQLYAVSTRLDIIPDFDDFSLSRDYGAAGFALSLIPGVGQIYKGQKGKGWAILGCEAALITGVIVCSVEKDYSKRKVRHEIPNVDSWKSKQKSWRQMRTLCLVAAGGLYVYNLIDAAVAKGSRHLIVNKADEKNVSIAPYIYNDGIGNGIGASFVLNF